MEEFTYGERVRINNTTIFGTYLGPVESKHLEIRGSKYCREGLGLSYFYDEELSKTIKVKMSSLRKAYEKWG